MTRGVPIDQLPAGVRRRLNLPAGKGRTRQRPSRAGIPDSTPCPGICSCGDVFESYAKWEQHAEFFGCSRWSIDLGETIR